MLHPVYEGAPTAGPTDIRNIILVATERAAPSQAFARRSVWNEVRRDARARRSRPHGARSATAGSATIPTGDVPLLTDDYAPTDALLLG